MREVCKINIDLNMTAENRCLPEKLAQRPLSIQSVGQDILSSTDNVNIPTDDVNVATDYRGAIHPEKKCSGDDDDDDDDSCALSVSSKSSKTVTFMLPGSDSQVGNNDSNDNNGTDGSEAVSDNTVSDNTALRGIDMASLPTCVDGSGGVDYTMRRPFSCVSAPALRTGWLHGLRTRGSMSNKRRVPGRYFPPLSGHKRSDRVPRDGTPRLQPTCSGYTKMHSSAVRGCCDSRVVVKSKAVLGRDWTRPRYHSAGVDGLRTSYADRPHAIGPDPLFSIKFRDPDVPLYDPSSEMTSDYYTIEKLYLFPKKTSRTRLHSDIACLQGQSKLLHVRMSRDT